MPHPQSVPQSPAERFAAILSRLSLMVDAMTGGGRLRFALAALIVARLIGIRQCVERVAARLAAGTFVPKNPPTTPPKRKAGQKPRPEKQLPRQYGWLLKIMPDAANPRAWLETLFADPEMVALMQAAPTTLGRPVRQLCRMLGIRPVPSPVALPEKPRKPRARWKWVKVPYERRPDPPDWPPILRGMRSSANWPGGRIRVRIDPPPEKT